MSHPFNDKRNHKVQHARVADITAACGGRMASGGSAHSDVAEDKSLVRQMVKKTALRATGGAVKSRADRPARARGGRLGAKKKSGHTVNVIVAPHPKPSMPPMVPGVGAAPPPPPPSPMMKPPMPPVGPAGPGMGGPPMPGAGMPPGVPPPGMRYAGGRTRKTGGKVEAGKTPSKAAFTVSTDGSNDDTSKNAGAGKGRTPITRAFASNKQDTQDIGRKPSILKATGGPITSDYAFKKGMAPHAKGGAMGGLAKLDKAHHPEKYRVP